MIGESSNVPSANWAFLHPDLLRLIYRKLYDTFDFIHFRAVCKLWRAAAPLSDHPAQFPFFLQRANYSSEFKLYSYTGKTHTIQVPEACDKDFYGQSHGYLITYQFRNRDSDARAALLNPFTRAERQLPFSKFRCLSPFHISGDPIRSADDSVIYMHCSSPRRVVTLRGSQYKEWNMRYQYCCSASHYNGRLFGYDWISRTCALFDLATGTVTSEIYFPNTKCFSFIVEGPGTLFGIENQYRSDIIDAQLECCSFDVYCLDESEKPPRWVKQSEIGDLMIFLNNDNGFCLSASDFDGFEGNCIYFSTYWYDNITLIGRYDLAKDKSELIAEVMPGFWIVPNVY